MKFIVVLLLAISFTLLPGCAGCSYSFTGASIPPHLDTIAIPMFDDRSGFGDPKLREMLTESVSQRFQTDGNLQLAESGNADSILDGVITSVTERVAVVEGLQDRATRMRITISVRITWQDLIKREIILEENLNNWGDYDATVPGPGQRTAGIEEAIIKLSEDILIATVARW